MQSIGNERSFFKNPLQPISKYRFRVGNVFSKADFCIVDRASLEEHFPYKVPPNRFSASFLPSLKFYNVKI